MFASVAPALASATDRAMIEGNAADNAQIVIAHDKRGTRDARLVRNGQQLSRVVIIPMLMRIGAAVVRMDGVGGVETAEAHRHHGYARRLMEFVVDDIGAGDASLSTLFGIEDFYQKFGYEAVGPEFTVTMPFPDTLSAASSLPSGWHFRPLTLGDLPAVMRLYHANTRRSTGALVRHDAGDDPEETTRLAGVNPEARQIGLRAWHKLRKIANGEGDDACRVLIDEQDGIAAYAWHGRGWFMDYRRRDMPDAFYLAEGMARDPIAADILLTACRLWANELQGAYTGIAFAIPPEGPLAAAATYEGGEILSAYTRGGDFMGRTLDLDRLLQQLLPELSARILTSGLHHSGELAIRTEDGESSLYISPAGISTMAPSQGKRLTAEIPQAMLARLCLGGFDNADVLARLPHKPDPATSSLLRALFPRRFPHIYPMDRF